MKNTHKYLLGAAALLATVAIFWFFGNIVLYIFIAGVLAIMCQPLVNKIASLRIGKGKLPRWVAAIVGVITMWAVIALFFVLFVPLISGKISDLAQLDYQSMLASLKEPLDSIGLFMHKYFKVDISARSLAEMFDSQIDKFLNIDSLTSIFSSVFSVAGSIAIAAVSISFISFHFMNEEGLFLKILLAIAPAKYEENVTRAVDKITSMLSRYFLGLLLQSTTMMLIISLILICCGFRPQDAFFVGIVEGVFNVIPYVGPWLGFFLSASAGLTFVTSTGLSIVWIVAIIAATIAVAQFIDNYFVAPNIYSRQVNAHPLEIFIVTLVAGSCSGILGMFIAIPAYTVLRILGKEFFYHIRLVRSLTSKMD
ncbi:MAG: AI-2E family transporter [Tidjanibacter sp.]|nr:AI-2E family transporter [Tidjanibacter sp.]